MSAITYHLVAAADFAASDPITPYWPAAFDADGFVHCTDGIENVIETANRHYRDDPRPFLLLTIDRARLTAAVRYDAAPEIYPHIYGPIDRAAIIAVTPLARAEDDRFRAPIDGAACR